jgi:hypothetical protein
MKHRIGLFLVSVLLLATGCTGKTQTSSTPITTSTTVKTSPTSAVMLGADLTQSVTPTKFSGPTSTLTPTATTTITPSAIIYPTQVYGLLLSPDGTKRVQSLDWNNYEVLTKDGKVLWTISYGNKLGAFEPEWHPIYWSLNGKYIYFTCYHGPDDGSTKFFGSAFHDGDCIDRFDVDTGKLVELIPEIHPGYYAFAISPDGSQLVYANQTETPVKIKLLDLNTQKERFLLIADKKVLEMGSFGWSPKMDRLIFTTLEMLDDEKRIYSIFMLDMKSLKTQILVKNFGDWLEFKSWNEQGQILYRDTYNNEWQLNLESKVLFPLATATPLQ